MNAKSFLSLISFIALMLAAGYLGTILQGDAITNWYQTIDKPPFNPPNWVFAPVWTTLYILIGIAGWMSWRKPDGFVRRTALLLFTFQLILNTAWTGIFFGLENPMLALVEIIVLLTTILGWAYFSYLCDKRTLWLIMPYILWVSFATILNLSIVVLN